MRAYHEGPTWRLAAECPTCGAPIRVRRRRADGERFVSCSAWPRCSWAGDYDPALQKLAAERDDFQQKFMSAVAELAASEDEIAKLRGGRRAPVSLDLARELRGIIALAHPDRWPHAPDLAHEVTARLTDLRRRCAA